MEVNFFGSVHCTAAALPSLRERGGMVVVMSSVAGFAPLWGRTGYAASKHALHGFFDSLRTEVEEIDVLVVCPSFTDTDMRAAALDGDGEPRGRAAATVGKVLMPDDVARAVVRGTRRRQRELLLSPIARASRWLSWLWPQAYVRLMKRNQSG